MFQFTGNAKVTVEYITELLKTLNASNDFNLCGDHFGRLHKALETIIDWETEPGMSDKIENSGDGYNFGGNNSWREDVEVAIQNVYDEEQAAAERKSQDAIDEQRDIELDRLESLKNNA